MTPPSDRRPTREQILVIWLVAKQAARRAGASPFEVDDVAQFTFIKLLLRWNRPNLIEMRETDEDRWLAYVRTTARRAYLDMIRSLMRSREREIFAYGADQPIPRAARPNVRRRQPFDDDDIARLVTRLEVIDMIEATELTENQYQVVMLHFIDGMEFVDIADKLGLSMQMVHRHKRNAIERIANHHDATVNGDGDCGEGGFLYGPF